LLSKTPQVAAELLPVAFLLLPIALTLYIVRKAQCVQEVDRVALWFSCVRFLRWLVIGTFGAWWASTDLLHWRERFDLLLAARGFFSLTGAPFAALILFWLPPVLVVLLCQILFQPVYSGVRGITWSKSELARQMLFSLGSTILPLLLLTSGITGIFSNRSLLSFVISCVLAFACLVFFARRLRKLLQLSPNALTTGELRDRAFFLASQLRVKLQQIYLLPPGKSRMANAYARSGHSILLTHHLLSHLTRKEVDAVIGHELAHIKKDHPRLLGLALLGGYTAVAFPYFAFSPPPQWKPLFDLLFVAVPLLTYYFVARRFEFIADATAVGVTGDPESMITCLAKIYRLNSLPLHWNRWSEKFLTHPSTLRRAQAIARLANLSKQRVAQLLAEPVPPSGHLQIASDASLFYPLATSGSVAQKVFSTEFKQSISFRSYLLLFLVVAALPALLLRICDLLNLFSSEFLAFVLSLLISVALLLGLLNFLPFLGASRLASRMLSRAETEGVIPPELLRGGAALLVGLSPGPAPRIFEGNYSWDAGYLFFSGQRLCYVGEESQFSLCRDHVVAVERGPGLPGWFRAPSLYIVWRNPASGFSAVFNLRPLAVRSVLAMNRALHQLAQRIAAWRAASISPPAIPSACEELPVPQVRAVTGTSLADAIKSRAYPGFVIWAAFFSGLVASLLHLPLQGLIPMFTGDGDSTVSYASISGWYAMLISCLLVFLLILPLLRARDASVQLSAAASSAIPPPPPGPS
jgi:Zn-dependent protease with chaperone function